MKQFIHSSRHLLFIAILLLSSMGGSLFQLANAQSHQNSSCLSMGAECGKESDSMLSPNSSHDTHLQCIELCVSASCTQCASATLLSLIPKITEQPMSSLVVQWHSVSLPLELRPPILA